MMQVNMLDAKTRLSSLVAAALQGEEVILARDGVPVAKIVKYDKPKVKPPGAWRGLVPISTDWNSAATNAEIERMFDGESRPLSGGRPGRGAGKQTRSKSASSR
jgi:antitoxin (DNA-binding transcriptional repressor) of toxin-antitoxin stability system